MARIGRSTAPILGAGLLALVALAAFLIFQLGGESVDASLLPVVQIGQTDATTGAPHTETTGPGQQGQGHVGATQPDPGTTTTPPMTGSTTTLYNSASTTTTAGSVTTATTVKETINGGVHTRTTGSPLGTTSTSGPGSTMGGPRTTTGGR